MSDGMLGTVPGGSQLLVTQNVAKAILSLEVNDCTFLLGGLQCSTFFFYVDTIGFFFFNISEYFYNDYLI